MSVRTASYESAAGLGAARGTPGSGSGRRRSLQSGEAEPDLCGGGGWLGAVGEGGQRGSHGLQGLRADEVGPGAFGVGAGLAEQVVEPVPVSGQGQAPTAPV